ncbi:MAG: type II toxin-antitoxin system VapC family toxin [Pyrinomonadaceae bacterium]
MNKILIDASPLIAIGDENEGNAHLQCAKIYKSIGGNFVTTMPCLTEAMYFLGESKGWHGQSKLWNLIGIDSLGIYRLTENDLFRMKILMEKYQDTPMDFADASLVVAAESLRTNKIFTLDSDFLYLSN